MNLPNLPCQMMDALSDGVAVMDLKGRLLYSNTALGSLCRRLGGPHERALLSELQSMNLRLFGSGEVCALDRLAVRGTDLDLHVSVYLIDNREGKERLSLLLIKEARSQDDSQGSAAEDSTDSPGKQEAFSGELSPEFRKLKGRDLRFKKALRTAQKAAGSELPVLIIGESGTGKELLAQAIHLTSGRRKMPFVDINCAAIPDSLIESELFGYERGAFTGARPEGRKGLFEKAHKGSIFLDEIGDASPQIQAKVLRVLQEGRFKRIGGTRNVQVDVRVISATNKDLKHQISQDNFRGDLLYRLNTVTINIPPLRQRRNDIRLLTNHFLSGYTEAGKDRLQFTPDCIGLMDSYEWPGNVRELKGVVDFAATMATDPWLSLDCLPSFLHELKKPGEIPTDFSLPYATTGGKKDLLATVIQKVEKDVIKQVLETSRTRSEAIERLGISRRTFYSKIKQYGLE